MSPYISRKTVDSYHGLQICKLVGLFILNHLGKKFGKKNIGLYKDDGLVLIKNRSAHLVDKTRKELHKVFEQFGLKITAEANLHVVNKTDFTIKWSIAIVKKSIAYTGGSKRCNLCFNEKMPFNHPRARAYTYIYIYICLEIILVSI